MLEDMFVYIIYACCMGKVDVVTVTLLCACVVLKLTFKVQDTNSLLCQSDIALKTARLNTHIYKQQ